jgi:hypothetical protein
MCYVDMITKGGPAGNIPTGPTYSATLSDGQALPTWLNFIPGSRSFTGNPPSIGKIYVTMVARIDYPNGGEVIQAASTFVINA